MQRFLFHAQAIGLAGRVKGQDFQHGVAVLPQHGGKRATRIVHVNQGDISAAYVASKVSGIETDRYWITTVSVTIEDLNLFNRIIADILSARLQGVWTKGEKSPVFTLDEVSYEGLRVDGKYADSTSDPIEVPGIGTLHTGENLVDEKIYRFTSFRLVLEPGLRSNEDGGEITGGDVVGNGHTYPP